MKFIFQVKLKDGFSERDYLEAWSTGSRVIQESEGALGTKLYRRIGKEGEYIAIATWESKEKRDRAMDKLNQDDSLQEVLTRHKNFGETEILGNYEEVAEVKLTK